MVKQPDYFSTAYLCEDTFHTDIKTLKILQKDGTWEIQKPKIKERDLEARFILVEFFKNEEGRIRSSQMTIDSIDNKKKMATITDFASFYFFRGSITERNLNVQFRFSEERGWINYYWGQDEMAGDIKIFKANCRRVN